MRKCIHVNPDGKLTYYFEVDVCILPTSLSVQGTSLGDLKELANICSIANHADVSKLCS